jgi:hypothetical protein
MAGVEEIRQGVTKHNEHSSAFGASMQSAKESYAETNALAAEVVEHAGKLLGSLLRLSTKLDGTVAHAKTGYDELVKAQEAIAPLGLEQSSNEDARELPVTNGYLREKTSEYHMQIQQIAGHMGALTGTARIYNESLQDFMGNVQGHVDDADILSNLSRAAIEGGEAYLNTIQ